MSDYGEDLDPVTAEFDDVGEAELEPPRWVVRNLIPTGITFLAGPPKSQKSTVALAACLTVSGHSVPDWPEEFEPLETGRVLGWSAEASAGELRHIAKVGLGVQVKDNRSFLIHRNPFQYRLDDPDGGPAMLAWLTEHRPRLALIDPLRDFHSLDEKDDGAMNRLLRPLQQWAKDNDAACLIVHHARKRSELTGRNFEPEDMRGTSALFGLADGILMTTPQGGVGVTIGATFKRGAAWTRTIKVGRWAAPPGAGAVAPLVVDALTRDVYRALRMGAENAGAIAHQIGVRKARVLEIFEAFEAHGLLQRRGKHRELTGDHDAKIAKLYEAFQRGGT